MARRQTIFTSKINRALVLGLVFPITLVACAIGTDIGRDQEIDAELAERLGLNLSDEMKSARLQQRWLERLAARPFEELRGDVKDLNGNPLAGVIVSVGGEKTRSDENGQYVIPKAHIGVQVITFQHPDYVLHQDHVYILPYQPPYTSAVLLHREDPEIVDADSPFSVTDDRVTLEFPSHSLVYQDTGESVSGKVAIQLTAIDPTLKDVVFSAPAPLQGIAVQGHTVVLRSFQMFEVEMWQGNRELQLAPGKMAKMTVELPAHAETSNGDRIPMWYVDETLGVWRQEREVDATIEAQNGHVVARASLPHFTCWNIDNSNDTVITRFKYAASDAADLQYVVLIETARHDGANWVSPGTAWAQKAVAISTDNLYERTFQVNSPQCGSDQKFKYKLRAKYINDANFYDLALNPPSNQNPSCIFGGNTAARVEFTSDEVCAYINCLGANRNSMGNPVSPEDGNLFGMQYGYIGLNTTPTDIQNQLGVTVFNNGQDGLGVRILNPQNAYVTRSFQLFSMPFDYTVTSNKATSTLPGANIDPGFAAYKSTSSTPGNAYYYDIDKDGVQDTLDNCMAHPNSSQTDSNNNGVGDVCEAACFISPNVPDRDWYDYDYDTIADECDNKPTIYNPAQAP